MEACENTKKQEQEGLFASLENTDICAESEEGKGSVFTVDLSLRIMDKEIEYALI